MGGIASADAGGWWGVYAHVIEPDQGPCANVSIRPIRAVSLTEGIVSLSPQRTLPDPQTSEY